MLPISNNSKPQDILNSWLDKNKYMLGSKTPKTIKNTVAIKSKNDKVHHVRLERKTTNSITNK